MNKNSIGAEFAKASHHTAPGVPQDDDQASLTELMELATQFHMGLSNKTTSPSDLDTLLQQIKERAASELDIGDGMKCETVRVERKLDGSVSIFFGI